MLYSRQDVYTVAYGEGDNMQLYQAQKKIMHSRNTEGQTFGQMADTA